jgi:hypothetical protein
MSVWSGSRHFLNVAGIRKYVIRRLPILLPLELIERHRPPQPRCSIVILVCAKSATASLVVHLLLKVLPDDRFERDNADRNRLLDAV